MKKFFKKIFMGVLCGALLFDGVYAAAETRVDGGKVDTFFRCNLLDDGWVGLTGSGGRFVFDSTPATDTISVTSSDFIAPTLYGSVSASGGITIGSTTNATKGTITLGTGTTDAIDWATGNVIYVPIGGSIEAYHDAATAGDTLILASGTYTITDDIDISKAINIVGQGVWTGTSGAGTLITCATATKNCFDISASNLRISNLSIANSGGNSAICINVAADLTGIVLTNLELAYSSTSGLGAYGIVSNSSLTVRDCIGTASGTGQNAFIYLNNSSTNTTDIVANVYNSRAVSTATGGAAGRNNYGYWAYNSNDANTVTINLYDCSAVMSAAPSSISNGVRSESVTTNTSTINVYGGSYSGANADVAQTGTNVLTLYGTTLVNGTTSGTITYAGTVVTGDSYIDDDLRIGYTTGQTDPATANIPNVTITTANSAVGHLGLESFNTTAARAASLSFLHSNSNTAGTLTTTDTAHSLGAIRFRGVDSGNNIDYGAYIQVIQNGAAGTTVPTDIICATADGTNSVAERFRIENDGDVNIGIASSSELRPDFKIIADADSDAADTDDTLTVTLTPNADPTLSTWGFTSTQSKGYSFDKGIIYTPEAVTGTEITVALSVAKVVSEITTDSAGATQADAFSLADGVAGQIKIIVYRVETDAGDTAVITPATALGFVSITFDTPGESCMLVYSTTTGWVIVSNNGGAIA